MTTIWRRFEAQACHYLPHVRVGHKCSKMHGHNFRVTVYVSRPGLVDGMVLDYEVLDAVWADHIKKKFDHDNVNRWIPNPTSEMIAMEIHSISCAKLPPPHDVVVEVEENDRSGARYP